MTPERGSPRAAVLGFAAGAGSSVCVGLLFALQKDLLNHFDPATLNWLEMIAAVAIATAAVVLKPGERRFEGHRLVPFLLLFGGIACMLFYMRNVGVKLTSATTASVVIRTEVAMVMLLSYVVLRVKPDLCGWLGAILLFFGAVLSLDLPSQTLRFTPWGTAALFLSAAGIAVNALIIRTRFAGVSGALTVLANALVQSCFFAVIVLGTGRWTMAREGLVDPLVAAKAALGGAFIFGALYLYYRAMKLIPMWSVRALSLLVPPITAVADHFWLGSPITGGQAMGLLGVTLGAALVIPCLTKGPARAPGLPTQDHGNL